jgi:hypothetical protein
VVAVRIDQSDGDERHADIVPTADASDTAGASLTPAPHDRPTPSGADSDRQARVARSIEHHVTVDARYRAYAIDQAYEKVRDIERGTVTPAMKRIEAEDPERHLAGLENSLKGKDRLAEKVADYVKSSPELSYDQACAKVKDAIRYTFVYGDNHYTEGVRADTERLANRFALIDLRNSWPAAEYKGINRQIFEVQFHTHASFEAKQFTHGAYEKIRDPATRRHERDKLQEFQRQVSADIPVPRDANDIQEYP